MPRFSRRKSRKSRKQSVAHRALRLAKRALSVQEMKFLDIVTAVNGLNSTGTLLELNLVPQGLADTSRVGDSLRMESMKIHYILENVDSSIAHYARVIVFYDKPNDISTSSQLLQHVATVQVINSAKQYDNRFNSNILYDRVHTLAAQGRQTSKSRTKKTIRIGKFTQFVSGTTGIDTGALKIIMFSEEPSPAANVNIDFTFRLKYKDS